MDWLQVFVNLILTGILLYVFQRVIDERSARRLEKFKAELKSESFEKETMFSKLHEKRLDIIAELYGKLYSVRDTLSSFLMVFQQMVNAKESGSEKVKGKWDEAWNTLEEFKRYLATNRLYLSNELCKQLDEYYEKSMQANINLLLAFFNDELSQLMIEGSDTLGKTSKQQLIAVTSVLSEQITPLLAEIEKEFRNLLGSS